MSSGGRENVSQTAPPANPLPLHRLWCCRGVQVAKDRGGGAWEKVHPSMCKLSLQGSPSLQMVPRVNRNHPSKNNYLSSRTSCHKAKKVSHSHYYPTLALLQSLPSHICKASLPRTRYLPIPLVHICPWPKGLQRLRPAPTKHWIFFLAPDL